MVYHEITSAENRDVVKAVGVFGVSFFSFSPVWSSGRRGNFEGGRDGLWERECEGA